MRRTHTLHTLGVGRARNRGSVRVRVRKSTAHVRWLSPQVRALLAISCQKLFYEEGHSGYYHYGPLEQPSASAYGRHEMDLAVGSSVGEVAASVHAARRYATPNTLPLPLPPLPRDYPYPGEPRDARRQAHPRAGRPRLRARVPRPHPAAAVRRRQGRALQERRRDTQPRAAIAPG